MQKSSNQVASAVFDDLRKKAEVGEMHNTTTLRLVADGCAGQNKNINMITMCGYWLYNHAPPNVKEMQLIFPVTGHSFLPSDRVFGVLEKELKGRSTIVQAIEYHEVFAKRGKVKLLGRDWNVYDWRLEAKNIVKSSQSLHFQVSKCKRIIMKLSKTKKHVLVSGELGYNMDIGTSMVITKKTKSFSQMNPAEIPLGYPVDPKKLKDVDNLLVKHYGVNWKDIERLQWYKAILERENTGDGDVDADGSELCECIEMEDHDDILIDQI